MIIVYIIVGVIGLGLIALGLIMEDCEQAIYVGTRFVFFAVILMTIQAYVFPLLEKLLALF